MLVKFTERTSDMILNVTQNIRLILYPIKTPITMRPSTVFYNYFQEKMKTTMIELVIQTTVTPIKIIVIMIT